MVDDTDSKPTPIGVYDRPKPATVTGSEMIAAVLSLVWLGGAALFFILLKPGYDDSTILQFVMTMLAIFMPVAMIWVATMTARSSRVMREEGQRLNASVEALRQSYVAQAQGEVRSGVEPTIAKKLDEIAAAQRKTESAITMFSTSRETQAVRAQAAAAAPVSPEDDQGLLALGTPIEDLAPPLENDDFIKALHFPETADDQEGFNALRRALKDRRSAALVQAAQDVLTLLSQDGIYMDDLRPDLARPEIWRLFAQGTRGRAVAALGGVRDRSSLALTAGRMKQDPIFRDATHHFLRRFDKSFVAFEQEATDTEIAALSETRTARAFMLLGRVAGMFD